ncbi:MAG: dihydrofolate reductase family protein [Candidatus Paceibacterota bacterium]|jgi:dihydrofolate reductase
MKTFIISALTADGFIAKNQTHAAMWTSKEDKKRFVEITKRAGVMVMGLNTWQTLGKPLKDRLNVVYSPTEIPTMPGMEITALPPTELLKSLEARGFKEVAICGGTTIYNMFMKAGLVSKLYLTIEPVLFGEGMKLFKEDLDFKLKLLNCEKTEGGTLLLEYEIVN